MPIFTLHYFVFQFFGMSIVDELQNNDVDKHRKRHKWDGNV